MNLSTEQRHLVERLYQSLDVDDTCTAVSVIVKTRGKTCDIDCPYCYEKRKDAPQTPHTCSVTYITKKERPLDSRSLALTYTGRMRAHDTDTI